MRGTKSELELKKTPLASITDYPRDPPVGQCPTQRRFEPF
jgi:hypothetical protein